MNEITVAVLQYALWPLVVVFALVFLREPLWRLLSNVRFLKAGSVEVSFQDQIEKQGLTESQSKAVRTLTATEVDLFLLVSFSDAPQFTYVSGMDVSEYRNAMLRLQEAGLITVINQDDPGTNIRHVTTPAGRRVRVLLVNSVLALLRADT